MLWLPGIGTMVTQWTSRQLCSQSYTSLSAKASKTKSWNSSWKKSSLKIKCLSKSNKSNISTSLQSTSKLITRSPSTRLSKRLIKVKGSNSMRHHLWCSSLESGLLCLWLASSNSSTHNSTIQDNSQCKVIIICRHSSQASSQCTDQLWDSHHLVTSSSIILPNHQTRVIRAEDENKFINFTLNFL